MSKYKKSRKKYLKKWREANKEHVLAYTKQRSKDPKFKEYHRMYERNKKALEKNPEQLRKIKAQKRQWRKVINRHNRIADNLRKIVTNAVNGGKSKRFPELLGCTVQQFRAYIEKQFHSGMTWENHGKVWQFDHIIPCAKFDFTKPEDQITCFHFSNMQPLFVMENLLKGDKILSPTSNENRNMIPAEVTALLEFVLKLAA